VLLGGEWNWVHFVERSFSPVYIGPDSLMPVASFFAAIAGVILMFWRRLVGALRMLFSRFTSKRASE
jgi:hypothetical protein